MPDVVEQHRAGAVAAGAPRTRSHRLVGEVWDDDLVVDVWRSAASSGARVSDVRGRVHVWERMPWAGGRASASVSV